MNLSFLNKVSLNIKLHVRVLKSLVIIEMVIKFKGIKSSTEQGIINKSCRQNIINANNNDQTVIRHVKVVFNQCGKK